MVKGKDELEIKLRAFIDLLLNNFRIDAVVLFGSYATGNPCDHSDVDVAVFSPDFGVNPLEEMTKLCKLRRKVDTDIEPIALPAKELYENSPADFAYEIINKGKFLFRDGKALV